MLGAVKRILIAAAVAVVGVAAPTTASAGWTDGGLPFNGSAHAGGVLTFDFAEGGYTTTCDVDGRFDLYNISWDGHGDVVRLDLDSCWTTLPGCAVSATANLPFGGWPIATGGTWVTVWLADFTFAHSGPSCALNGVVVGVTGSFGDWHDGVSAINFLGSGPLSTTIGGSVALSGWIHLHVEWGPGVPDLGRPVGLV